MNEYMPDQGYGSNMQNMQPAQSDIGRHLRYTNIILTVILAVVLIAGGVILVMIARVSKAADKNSKDLTTISKDLSSMDKELNRVSKTVDDILEQGCTGSSSNSGQDPDDPYDPFYPEYGVEKPVIYLYGDKELTDVHVELALDKADMNVTWPSAVQKDNVFGWDVSVSRDGTITDPEGYEYSYLFWEASDYGEHSFDKGFCVSGADTAEFLRSKLTEIGLSSKECNEFITYWLPRMQGNNYNLITFEGLDSEDDYNRDFGLKVTDSEGNEAESMLRVMMVWKASDEPEEIEAQEFTGFERKGLIVVEWGGAEVR